MTFRIFAYLTVAATLPFSQGMAQVVQAPAPAAEPAPPQAPAPATAPSTTLSGPDYPDPRGLTIGLIYWFTGPGINAGLITGHKATDYESLPDLGKAHRSPGVEVSYPVTRTGVLRFEGFETNGTGNQLAPAATDLFTTTSIAKGDYLATAYQFKEYKLVLDDLLFPHKFPVSRFRLKSLWAVQLITMHATISEPLNTTTTIADDTRKVVLPTVGLAAEYALTKHVLFRVEASGFGLYHKADIWDAAATLAVRHGHWEVVGGAKALHFKSSPNDTSFLVATLAGGFVGARWIF